MEIGPQFNEYIVPNQSPYVSQSKSVERMQEPPSVSITPAPNTTAKNIATRPNKLNIASPIRPATNLHNTEFCNFGIDVSATRLSASPG